VIERLRKVLKRQSEVRARLNELNQMAEPTEAQTTELQGLVGDAQAIESELREAIDADAAAEAAEKRARDDASDGAAETAEQRERRGLLERCRLGRYVAAVLSRGDAGMVDGAEAELAAAEGCPGKVPITILGPTVERRQTNRWGEQRAVTAAPADGDLPTTHAPIVPAVFDRSVAAYLGVEMPTVPTGIRSYPILSTSVTGGMVAEDGAAANTAGAYTVVDTDPRRLTGAFTVRKEDIAKMPDLEMSLRENLSRVLSDELDKQLVNGSNMSGQLNGILAQLTDPSAPSGEENYASYQTAFSSHIDGLMAVGPMDVRALVGVATLRHMMQEYRADEDATTAYDMLMQKYGGVRATRRIAAPSSNVQQAVIRRSNPMGDRVAVAPVWMGMELIRDIYGDNASKGQVTVTAVSLVGGVALLRSNAFVQDSFQVGS